MDILGNTGTDLRVYIYIAFFAVLLIVLWWRGKPLIAALLGAGDNTEESAKELRRQAKLSVLTMLALAAVLWILFGAYGSGTPARRTPVEEDGIYQKTQEDLKKAETDPMPKVKPKPLSAVDDLLNETEGVSHDDEIKKAIEAAQKGQ